ncbi:RNA polymerase sigma factor [Caulobacter segnis]|uniref:RNA polymerase sigma factor n=1 Tax=Caulobacter segnis TaxID=88688 RepID=UPI00240FE4A4|nr:RNA polymerase sigma factor [Caulobacter segnis]MDG2520520.1 RNA polymerase sigma factor [Caulobacter segnis]
MRWPLSQPQLPTAWSDCERIYRSHSAWLARSLRRSLPQNQIEEVVQETFARLAQYEALDGIRSPKAFLLRVAINIAVKRHQRETRLATEPLKSTALDHQYGQSADQISHLAYKEVIRALPATYQETFILSRVVGLTYEEIAVRLGVSVKTVEWRMSKAIALCSALLNEGEP